MSLFPLNYFFQFLYYTDSGSTLFVLAAYYLMLKKLYQPSAYVAAISIIFRQTNVVWLVFSLALLLVANLEQLVCTKSSASAASANQAARKNNGNRIFKRHWWTFLWIILFIHSNKWKRIMKKNYLKLMTRIKVFERLFKKLDKTHIDIDYLIL